MAQLIIDGKEYGMHAFICQLRDLHNHKPLPGIISIIYLPLYLSVILACFFLFLYIFIIFYFTWFFLQALNLEISIPSLAMTTWTMVTWSLTTTVYPETICSWNMLRYLSFHLWMLIDDDVDDFCNLSLYFRSFSRLLGDSFYSCW